MPERRISERRAKLEAKLKKVVEQERETAKRNNLRRQALVGRVALDHSATNEAFSNQLRALLDTALTSPKDRALFDLPPKSDTTPAAEPEPEPAQAAAADSSFWQRG